MAALIPFDEALAHVLDKVQPLAAETVALQEAGGRTLAAPILARHDQPPAAISAMDGYAVGEADAAVGATLTVVGEAPAGFPFPRTVLPGQAVRIATGGVVPAGAQRIVIQEHGVRSGDSLRVTDVSEASFIRPAGADFVTGQTLVEAGELLTPARLGLVAAGGLGQVSVRRRPRVAVLPSGDELRQPGAALQPGTVFNSAAFAVAALVERWGATAVQHAILPDDVQALDARLANDDLAVDVLVPLGGASVGDRDALRPAFERLGAALVFDRVAVIPGKPTWHARFPDGRLLVGLPGNPSSAFVCAYLFLRPLLHRLGGRAGEPSLASGTLTTPLAANGPREAWLRARTQNVDGVIQVHVDPRQDSNLQTPLASSNALVRRQVRAAESLPGEVVSFLPF